MADQEWRLGQVELLDEVVKPLGIFERSPRNTWSCGPSKSRQVHPIVSTQSIELFTERLPESP
jgi:hypothetical protein